tara:strand:- start:117 stop:431 length:315 start_codon:yes stop_codon:yes gene_type:complete
MTTSLFEAKQMADESRKKLNKDAERHSYIHNIKELEFTMENFIYQLEILNEHHKELPVSAYKDFIYELDEQIRNILPEKEDKNLRYLNNKPRRIYFDPSKKLPF